MLNRNKNKINPARALLAYSEGLKNFIGTLKTPANAGNKGYTQKGVGCLLVIDSLFENMSVKKIYLIILLIFGFAELRAQSSSTLCAVVETTNGERLEYLLSDLPRIIYEDSMVTLTTNTAVVEFRPDDINKIYLTESITAINDCKSSAGSFYLSNDQILLSGFTANEVVTLYSVDGLQLWSGSVHANGHLIISLEHLSTGIYIIKTNHQSIKISKK